MSHSDHGTIRRYVLDTIRPHVPDDWQVEDRIPTLDRKLARPVLWLEYGAFAPLEGTNPASGDVAATVDVCVATNRTDMRTGEADADDLVADLYHALIEARAFYGMTASKAVFDQAYFGWKITCTIATKNKKAST